MKIVLSASRRTDIPAFYMKWFMEGIERGEFSVRHPFTGAVRKVEAGPHRVHSIVFWSKDFGSFLENGCGERLQEIGYHLFFNFTVNSPDSMLEPRVPPLTPRLAQLEALSRRFGPDCIQWRFDPVCLYRTPDGRTHDNLGDFKRIADIAAAAGVKRCVTSFLDLYAKVRRRAARSDGVSFIDPPLAKKVSVLESMARILEDKQIRLFTCCEKEVLAAAGQKSAVLPAACIPSEILMGLYGGRLSLRQDPGQRTAQGCGCRISVDIGSYKDQPCRHRCLFCYANPAETASPQDRLEAGRPKNGGEKLNG